MTILFYDDYSGLVSSFRKIIIREIADARKMSTQVLHTAFRATTSVVDSVDNYHVHEYLIFIENSHSDSYGLMPEHLCDNFHGEGIPS